MIFGFELDGMIVAFHVATELLLCSLGIELGIVFDLLHQLVVALDRRVVPEHVENEALLDRLLHRVAVEGPVLNRAIRLRLGLAKDLERLVLGRGSKGEVAGVG